MQIVHTIQISQKTIKTPIYFGEKILSQLPDLLKEKMPAHSYVVITDSNLNKIYGDLLKNLFDEHGLQIKIISFEAGEASKNASTKQIIEDQMLANAIGRDSAIIAFGGGVVGDMAGFVASTYLRGIPYVQIPTSILAMVDSSIGGKVGIDTPYGKSLIGAFWHPNFIFTDLYFLNTLDNENHQNGWFEIIKLFACTDKNLFELARTKKTQDLLKSAMQIKADIVSKDERESGMRSILNFGHTVGHAIELLSEYSILHGFAVGLGMWIEAKIAEDAGMISGKEFAELENVLIDFGMQKNTIKTFNADDLWHAMQVDKKNRLGNVKIIMLNGIGSVAGEPSFTHNIDKNVFVKAFESLKNHS